MNTLLAIFFVFANIAVSTSGTPGVRVLVKEFLKNRPPLVYPFVFVLVCYLGFSLWESLLYFLFGVEREDFLRAALGSFFGVFALVAGADRQRSKKGLSSILKLGDWGKTKEAQLILGGVSWTVLLGSWVAFVVFAPWLAIRWKKLKAKNSN